MSENNCSKSADLAKENFIKDEPANHVVLSYGGEVFRQNLLKHFENESKNQKSSKYLTAQNVITDEGLIDDLMINDPFNTIKFNTYSKTNRLKFGVENKLRFVSNRRKKFLNCFKKFENILLSKKFSYFLIAILIIDSLSIGLAIDTYEHDIKNNLIALSVLASIQLFALIIFCLEVIVKANYESEIFLKSAWNIFDLALIFVSSIFQAIDVSLLICSFLYENFELKNEILNFLKNFKVFRILKNFKIISQFIEMRIIIVCLTRAMRSVILISILLFIFAFIYAKIGVVLFSNLNLPNEYFPSIYTALLTLFSIMTLDQWWKIFTSSSELQPILSSIYFISWIILASFIFLNLFTGIMVDNFQQIRENVVNSIKIKSLKKSKQSSRNSIRNSSMLENVLSSSKLSFEKNSFKKFNFKSEKEILNQILDEMGNYRSESNDWNKLVREVIDMIKDFPLENQNIIWPEDTLLRYYELMQLMMDNLKERIYLNDMANESLIKMHDRDNFL